MLQNKRSRDIASISRLLNNVDEVYKVQELSHCIEKIIIGYTANQ